MLFASLSFGAEKEQNPTPSPDGQYVAFTRGGDLWLRSVADSVETRLTGDGTDLILNGYASWVYYEEIFGRGSNYKAFWWSPDSKKIAYYRFDNTEVTLFPIFAPFGQNGSLRQTRYPKAGQQNPGVRIAFTDLEGHTTWADFDEGEDQYFGTPFWGADSRELYVSREPRRQNQLDLYAVSAADGSKRQIYHEEYPTWVEWIEGMLFTEEGLYMARNFESGWEQIYFLGYDGSLRCLTDGKNWGISLLEIDPRSGDLYFTAQRDSRVHTCLYKLTRKGKVICLTDPEYNLSGWPSFSEDYASFTARLSNGRTPTFSVEGRTDCYSQKVTSEPSTINLADYPSPQLVTIQNDGFDLYALLSLPRNFDPEKKYPVVMQLYGGPGTPYVRDTWRNRDAGDQWCFDNGIIYIVADPRSSGENGRRGMDEAFGRMTVIELGDYIAWAKYLQSLPYVEGSKIGVEGFSFGGTTTSMLVLRYPEYFSCGVAGGGVYDWTLYDSHYTERFMDTPQANPEGYKIASVLSFIPEIFAPENASRRPKDGALKLTHGTSDDNVHFQNTLLLIDALQKVNYQFELMIYPGGMHGYRGEQAVHDKTSDHIFWTRHLLN